MRCLFICSFICRENSKAEVSSRGAAETEQAHEICALEYIYIYYVTISSDLDILHIISSYLYIFVYNLL